VEILVEYNPDGPLVEGDETRFVVELAAMDEMPHTVYWFLDKVDQKLYDGCSFYANPDHVVMGGATRNFLTPPTTNLLKNFEDVGWDHVLFQEYSDSFPHDPYTLGLAGRPGGPSFYVNLKDNTKIHGHDTIIAREDATNVDPCFAKVVEGFEAVDRMHRSPTKDSEHFDLKENIAIRSMRILGEL
jgi:cyclophilin family peptidyl-prolyl cis-trans isomerase